MTRLKEINPHFEEFIFHWGCKFYFLLGGYGSGKSHAVALKLVLKLLEEKRTALVVRNVFETHRDSSFSLLKEIVSDLDIEKHVKINVSPMKFNFYNGSTIIFKGMDKPEKLKSINDVSIVWLEEASEVPYAGFKELLGRLRHPSMSLHFVLSTNPVEFQNWTYTHFFRGNEHEVLDHESLYKSRRILLGDTFYHHSVAEDNRFLPQSYVQQLEELKEYDLDMYRVGRLGRFGANGVKVLPSFRVEPHADVMERVEQCKIFRAGMDFGFETSYNALLRLAVDPRSQTLFIYWEYYKNKQTDDLTAADIDEFKQSGELIYADCAEPKTIKYFQQQGFSMVGAKKFPNSRLANVKKLRRFKAVVCSDRCAMTAAELSNLVFSKDRNGDIVYDTFNIDAHTLSAIWYGLDGYEVADLKPRHTIRGKSMY